MFLMGRVNDMATLVKAVLPMERGRRINRFMNAAHVAMYTGLSSTYEKDNFFDPLEARFALLTDEELYRIVNEIDVDNSGAKASFEIITWIMCDIRDAQINSFIDTNEAMQMRELLLKFRSTIAKVFVTTTLPIPFFYVHFLSMLTAVYLPLFAVVVASETGVQSENSSVWVGEIVSALVVFLQALFVIGLRILGQQLSDPYGGDLIDLQIARYVNMILNGSNQILCSKRLHAPSVETELRLQLKMSSLGQAFEYDTDDEVVIQH
jgi:predicted membrane chloride channel (bestrophin family)